PGCVYFTTWGEEGSLSPREVAGAARPCVEYKGASSSRGEVPGAAQRSMTAFREYPASFHFDQVLFVFLPFLVEPLAGELVTVLLDPVEVHPVFTPADSLVVADKNVAVQEADARLDEIAFFVP